MTEAPRTATYWGISIFSSKTFWVNAAVFLVAASSMTEVTTIIPPRFLPMLGAVVALANVYLRTQTVRPAMLIKPGDTRPMKVARIDPPAPPPLTD